MNTHVWKTVKDHYGAQIGKKSGSCCGNSDFDQQAEIIGYTSKDIQSAPDTSNLGLGCGNPLAFSQIKIGDTVLDLGSGAGFDCFIAAKEVGDSGKVIGVDMTEEMINRANENIRKMNSRNIEFRLGQIEDLPVDSDSVDLVISNCVINLSPDKPAVFREAFRVLKPGGKLVISDIVLKHRLPWFIRKSTEAYNACIAGASLKMDYLKYIEEAGFTDIKIQDEISVGAIFPESDPLLKKMLRYIPLPKSAVKSLSSYYATSMKVMAVKN